MFVRILSSVSTRSEVALETSFDRADLLSKWAIFWSFNFFSFTCSFQFMDFASVSGPSKDLFGIGDNELNWLYSASLLGVVFSMIPYAYGVEKYNYLSYAFGVVSVTIGAWIRYVSAVQESYLLAVISSVLLGIGNAVALVLYGTIPYLWFPESERSLALSVAVQSNYAGWCLGSFLLPRVVEHKDDFPAFFLVQAIAVSVNVLLFAAFYREKPLSHCRYEDASSAVEAAKGEPTPNLLVNDGGSCEALFRYDDDDDERTARRTSPPEIPPKPETLTRPASSGPRRILKDDDDMTSSLLESEEASARSSLEKVGCALLRNRQFLLHTFCVTLLGGASFAVSAVVDLVVTKDDRFTDKDAAWMNTSYILSGVIAGISLGFCAKRRPESVGGLLRCLFLLAALALTSLAGVSYVNMHVDRFDFDLLFVIYVALFSLVGVAALGFCGLSLSLAIGAAMLTDGVSKSVATTIPELGLNAFGAAVTQASNADTGFLVCAGLSWLVFVSMCAYYEPLPKKRFGGGSH
eukprot:g1193.t1